MQIVGGLEALQYRVFSRPLTYEFQAILQAMCRELQRRVVGFSRRPAEPIAPAVIQRWDEREREIQSLQARIDELRGGWTKTKGE